MFEWSFSCWSPMQNQIHRFICDISVPSMFVRPLWAQTSLNSSSVNLIVFAAVSDSQQHYSGVHYLGIGMYKDIWEIFNNHCGVLFSVYEGNHASVNTDHGDKQEILSLTQSFQSQLDQQHGSGNNQHITLVDSHYSFLSHIASIKKFISGDLVSGLTLNLLILGTFTLSIRNAKYPTGWKQNLI